jgi:hypothetical protein
MTPVVGAFFLRAAAKLPPQIVRVIELRAMCPLLLSALWGSLASCAPVVYRRNWHVQRARSPFDRRVLRCASMRPAHRAPWGLSLLAGALIAAFLAQAFLASAIKSPVFDETGDIAAGLSYVQSGEVRANLQHPPLLKEMAGASLWLAGCSLPDSPQMRQMLADGGGERAVGAQLIAANGPGRTMFWARLPFLLLAAALGVLLYLWGRQLLGDVAALAALFLYTLDPTILGHGYLATMDLGLAAFTVLFLFALWHYLEYPDTFRIPNSNPSHDRGTPWGREWPPQNTKTCL